MLGQFQTYDTQLFLSINHLPHNFLFDAFFGFITLIGYFGAIWLLFGFILTLSNKKRVKNLLAVLLSAEILYLILIEFFLKNISGRLRPQYSLSDTILPFNFVNSYSFPSGHATVSFAAALILSYYHKKLKWFYYFLAFLISFSRIYLGKHYPSDVVAGAILGLLIGNISIRVVKNF